jgi:ADP-ribosyl-[dinitrogen reductase] hydrolase
MENVIDCKKNNSKIFDKVQEKIIKNFKEICKADYWDKDPEDFGELTYIKSDQDYEKIVNIMNSHKMNSVVDFLNSIKKNLSIQQSRAIACIVCSGIGDALGTHTEFTPIKYNINESLIDGFENQKFQPTRCNLGEFSDDTSMALCLADSIFINEYKFNGADLQIKFVNWWLSSYNNCLFPRRDSFGLGGNISQSINEFIKKGKQLCKGSGLENLDELPNACSYSDKEANGNGSLMRLAPVPIAFASDLKYLNYAKDYAYSQSKVTHTGEEAAESCRLLTHLICKLINRPEDDSRKISEYIDEALQDFESSDYSVNCLAKSIKEEENVFNERLKSGKYKEKFSKSVDDRNWNWKDSQFKYSPTRSDWMPAYIGSYCLDALSMALHLSYYSKSPKQAIIKSVNMGGDSDTVSAIVGQIVGSYYGIDEEILKLYEGVAKYDNYKLAFMGYMLYNGDKIIE